MSGAERVHFTAGVYLRLPTQAGPVTGARGHRCPGFEGSIAPRARLMFASSGGACATEGRLGAVWEEPERARLTHQPLETALGAAAPGLTS